MIKLHESTFFFIIFLTSIITYIIFVIFQSCDIKCKINYYKYENYYKNVHETDSKISSDMINNIQNENISNDNSMISNKTSSHSGLLQGNDINYSEDEQYINKLLNPNLFIN